MSCAFPSPSFAQTIARLCASEQIPSTSTRNLTRTNLERGRKCGRAVESRVSRPQISSRTSVAANSCVCMSLSSPYPMAVNSEKAPILRPGEVEEVNIRVSARPYPVYIGCGIMCDTELLRRHIRGKHVLIITNTKVSPLYLDGLLMSITNIGRDMNVEAICLDDGEEHKNQKSVAEVINIAVKERMDHTTTFVGLGGGVINDVCGFSAACYQGGVNYIQIPTTFRAQVDLSVAHEVGIYHLLDKRSICSYYEPECVIADTDTLKTLPGKELISGIAETVKFSLARDGTFLHWLKENMTQMLERHPAAVADAIRRCCMIKAELLQNDRRDILTLGQPFGHGILRSMDQGPKGMEQKDGVSESRERREWLHGEALSVGIVMAVDLSHRLKWIDDTVLMDAVIAMEKAHLPTAPPAHISKANLKQNMDLPHDRCLKLALPKGVAGECIFTQDYDPQVLESMLTFFCLGDRE